MDKLSVKKLFNNKAKDYTYTIGFFVIFSFFIFAVIRPNLVTVFEINAKIKQLKEVDKVYGSQIDKIVTVQSVFESNREDMYLLNEAISIQPEVNRILSDINVSSDESSLKTERISVSDLNLKDKGALNKLKSFKVNMDLVGNFEDTLAFIKKLYVQRRLKLLPDFELTNQVATSSESAGLKIKLNVEGYYL